MGVSHVCVLGWQCKDSVPPCRLSLLGRWEHWAHAVRVGQVQGLWASSAAIELALGSKDVGVQARCKVGPKRQ